jgi:mono/diheme cytochrome c family protein
MSHDKLDYTGPDGTVLYTVSNDGVTEIPLVLAMRGYWEALGLPLTAFFDGSLGNIREATETIIRPYQKALVSLAEWQDDNSDDIPQTAEISILDDPRSGEAITFAGTNPIDVPGCDKCHASERANGTDYTLWKKEYTFWKNRFPNTSDYYASLKAASISLLEIHDAKHDTEFLKNYDPDNRTGASVTRLGSAPVRCQECHADNIVGQLKGKRTAGDSKAISSLTQAVHLLHLTSAPEPDSHGRTTSCQGCHPAHQQSGELNYFPLSSKGEFRGGDIRDYRGGCFLGRDLHSNPETGAKLGTARHLNAIGKWLQDNVLADGKGLYCTNCHNLASRLLYKADTLENALTFAGKTLRETAIPDMVTAFRQMAGGRYAQFSAEDFFDPKVTDQSPVDAVWLDEPSDPYRIVDDAGDYWLAAGEPKCGDCHLPPFVENMGGSYFPIDQVEKLSLMRYSKGHHGISCQSCHQSTHGLYPVRADGADPTSLSQAQHLNPDGHPGPLRCATCHTVDGDGVPALLKPEMLAPFLKTVYPTRYEQAVAYMHTARTYEEIHGVGK